MIFIASGAFVNSEFQIEFGRIPPAFLPLGNQRLYEHQVTALRRAFGGERIVLSMPEDYELAPFDARRLQQLGVHTVRSDAQLRLGQAIAWAIERWVPEGEALRLLHGDTLLSDYPAKTDVLAMAKSHQDYAWEIERQGPWSGFVWCGYFSFSRPASFARQLHDTDHEFVQAVRGYDQLHPLDRVEAASWRDFGHISSYYQSRSQMTTERAFNALQCSDGWVQKRSADANKLHAEWNWFDAVPPSLRVYLPQVAPCEQAEGEHFGYQTEFLPLTPLNELLVYGRAPLYHWRRVLRLCLGFLADCHMHGERLGAAQQVGAGASRRMYADKTHARLDAFLKDHGRLTGRTPIVVNGAKPVNLDELIAASIAALDAEPPWPAVVHGDFCFSNILFDSRADRIKVIDPRGLDADGHPTIFGDARYDHAKLAHSALGLYDFIIAGAYALDVDETPDVLHLNMRLYIDERTLMIQNEYDVAMQAAGLSAEALLPYVTLLFVSMLPLHADDRRKQMALLANAVRLFHGWKSPQAAT